MDRRKAGAFDQYFYFFQTGSKNTNSIRLNLILKHDVDPQKLEGAINAACVLYPEFAVRAIIKDNCVWYEKNPEACKVHEFKNIPFVYGTEDTEGYLFRFSYKKNRMYFEWIHAIADFSGGFTFLKSVMDEYLKLMGLEGGVDSSMRTSPPDEKKEQPDIFDPFSIIGGEPDKELGGFELADMNVFNIPEDDFGGRMEDTQKVLIECDGASIVEAAKRENLKVSGFLFLLISSAIRQVYEVYDKRICAPLSVDCRGLFGIKTNKNFSSGITLIDEAGDKGFSFKERVKSVSESLSMQIKKETFEAAYRSLAGLADNFIHGEKSIEEWSETQLERVGILQNQTFQYTYVKKLMFPGSVNDEIVTVYPDQNNPVLFFSAYTERDKIVFISVKRYRDLRIEKKCVIYVVNISV